MSKGSRLFQLILVASLLAVLVLAADAASVSTRTRYPKARTQRITESSRTQRKLSQSRHSRTVARSSRVRRLRGRRHRRYYERFNTSSFAEDQTSGDVVAGEDPVVRQAALEALGNMNGTVVAVDPNTGRILAMVNQQLALSEGGQPCSTIKLAVGLAALSEGIVTKDTMVSLGRRYRMDMTDALAHSNNTYFEVLGRRLGFEKVTYYAHQFGLGEMAGWDIAGEHLGEFPSEEVSAKLGGVGKMCSFGEGISMTPLQLAALVSAIANGGTLYYLQHPTTPEAVANFQPKVKRHLDIAPVIPPLLTGMAGAVQYGTARSVRYTFGDEQIMGKTGTCSKDGTRFGWFASFANTDRGKIAVVMFLRGGRPTFGPKAAELSGHLYRTLYDHNFFAEKAPVVDRTTITAGAPQ